MKYYNKKKIERSLWTRVTVSSNDYNKERFLWCQRQESTGRFYRYYGNFSWWFEHKEDAALFILTWS